MIRKRSLSIVAIALLAFGCSSRSAVPSPPNQRVAAPQVIQHQPLTGGVWMIADDTGTVFFPVSDGKSKIWFLGGGGIGFITMGQKETVYAFNPNVEPADLTVGPDGNLWMSGFSDVIRMTPAGVESDFPYEIDALSRSITSGSDGALWFTVCPTPGEGCGATTASTVGRMTTAGGFTSFSLPKNPDSSEPSLVTMVAGPDGNLWIADSNGFIHKFTTSGLDKAFAVDGRPSSIVVGPDGALYFTTEIVNKNVIGRITISGSVTYITEPSGYEGLRYLTSGPGNLLWAAGNGSNVNALTWYDPATSTFGPLIHAPLGDNCPICINGIAAGPDRNIWVPLGDKILTYVRLVMVATPSNLTIAAPGDTGSFTVTEENFHGTWTPYTSSRSIATIVQTSPGSFTVTANAVGHCRMIVSDGSGNTLPVYVTVQ